jgi:hypothetical protein
MNYNFAFLHLARHLPYHQVAILSFADAEICPYFFIVLNELLRQLPSLEHVHSFGLPKPFNLK